MKKILLLGGSAQQVIVIKIAKKYGFYTVLCDYLPDNPGQYEADKFYLVSTTDKEAVLDVAEKEQIDGVLAYASDPAAPTAAYVAEQLGLPGNPYASVEILCNKAKFRRFLTENGFATPTAQEFTKESDAVAALASGKFNFPVIVKPTDSSGSKGVSVINSLEKCVDQIKNAFAFSRSHAIIIEEYVESDFYQVAGDGLSVDGELVFSCFANDHFDDESPNPFVPVAASFPSVLPNEMQNMISSEIQRLLTLLRMSTCTYNFDIRIGRDNRVYLMEVAPRDGGNYIPQVIGYLTNVNLADFSVLSAMGERIIVPVDCSPKGFYAYYAVHSLVDGVLDSVEIDPDTEKNHIVENHISVKKGDSVSRFIGSSSTLGCLVMRFDSENQMLHMIEHPEEWLEIKC